MDARFGTCVLLRSPAMPIAILNTDGRGHNGEAYLNGYRRAGAESFLLSDDIGEARLQLRRVKALVVTGVPRDGRDVDPTVYGGERDPRCGRTDRLADERQLAVIEVALRWGLPLVGTCLGMHLVVCALGGRLIQHVDGHVSPDPAHETVSVGIAVVASSALAETVGPVTIGRCMHHQAIDPVALPAGLTVTARSGDGVVHAIEAGDIHLYQHHPERDLNGDGLRTIRARIEALHATP